MLTTYFEFIEGKKVVFWCATRDAFFRRLASAHGDHMAPYSPIHYGSV